MYSLPTSGASPVCRPIRTLSRAAGSWRSPRQRWAEQVSQGGLRLLAVDGALEIEQWMRGHQMFVHLAITSHVKSRIWVVSAVGLERDRGGVGPTEVGEVGERDYAVVDETCVRIQDDNPGQV